MSILDGIGDILGGLDELSVKFGNGGASYDPEDGLNVNIKPANKRTPRLKDNQKLLAEELPPEFKHRGWMKRDLELPVYDNEEEEDDDEDEDEDEEDWDDE